MKKPVWKVYQQNKANKYKIEATKTNNIRQLNSFE